MDLAPDSRHGGWNPLIVSPNTELSSRIRLALMELGAGEIRHLAEYPKIGTIASLAAQIKAGVCFLDVCSNPEHALRLIGEASAVVPIVALNPSNDAEMILRCLRRGAAEFLSHAAPDDIAAVLDHLRRARAPGERRKQALVYSVLPAKAGSGASTLAVQLAIEMKRQGLPRVLLVDSDIVAGTIAFLLKLKPEYHLGDVVRDCRHIDEDVWSRLTARSHGTDVLPAPDNPATRVDLNRQAAVELLGFWREHYDAVVIDTPAAHLASLDMVQLSDSVLLVTGSDLPALYAAQRAIGYLEHNGADLRRFRLVVNRHTSHGSLKREEVLAALKLEPCAVLQEDPGAIAEAILNGTPVSATSRWGRSVRALAAQLSGIAKPVEKRKSFFGLVTGKK